MGGVPPQQIKHKVDENIRMAPPPGHPNPSRETMSNTLKPMMGSSGLCDLDTTLLNAVYDYFLHLVGRMPHASLSDNFCSRCTALSVPMERRMLMVFGQCSNIPVFTFNLTKKEDIHHWLRLYHTAMRCSIHPCQSGFVFILWSWWNYDDKNGTRKQMWHVTSMYFNFQTNQQIFIDPPSGRLILNACWLHRWPSILGVVYFRVVKTYHDPDYRPYDISKTLQFSVVDGSIDQQDNLQSYFAAPWSTKLEGTLCDTQGCCSTVTILIVVMCLRFRCKDPQLMVNIIRCIMRHLHRTLRKGDLIRFLLQIRQWQNHLVDQELSDEEFRFWLGITCKPGTQRCNCVLHDAKSLCPLPCQGGTVWCLGHAMKARPTQPWMGTSLEARLRRDRSIFQHFNTLRLQYTILGTP